MPCRDSHEVLLDSQTYLVETGVRLLSVRFGVMLRALLDVQFPFAAGLHAYLARLARQTISLRESHCRATRPSQSGVGTRWLIGSVEKRSPIFLTRPLSKRHMLKVCRAVTAELAIKKMY